MMKPGFRAFTLLLVGLQVLTACGDKKPPEAPTSLAGGSLQAIEPINPAGTDIAPAGSGGDPAGTEPAGGSDTFNPNDNFNGDGPPPSAPPAKPSAKPTATPAEAPSPEPGASTTPAPTASDATASPTPSSSDATASPTPTPSSSDTTASPTPTPSVTTTPTPTPTPVPTPTPTPTPTPVPTPTPTPDPYGNRQLSAIGAGTLTNDTNMPSSGLDVKNGVIYVGGYVKGNIVSNNNVLVKAFTPSGSNTSNVTIVSQFSSSGLEPLVGVAVRGGTIWSARKTQNSSGTNLYKNNTAGQAIATYKAGTTGSVINDIAADPTAAILYIADSVNSSIIKFDETTPANSQLYFSGATPINAVGLATDATGNVYAADANTGKVLKFSSTGTKTLEFDGKGKNGTGQLYSAIGDLAVDPRNNEIYVTGVADGVVKIFRYSAEGNFIRSFSSADLTSPEKMSIGNDGTIYIVDKNKNAVMVFGPGTAPSS